MATEADRMRQRICVWRDPRGKRCKRLVHGTEEPALCALHGGPERPWCVEKNARGLAFKAYAIRGSDPPRCAFHLGLRRQRCTASNASGEPCRAFAKRDTDPPRCWRHGVARVACSYLRLGGRACRIPAVIGSDPPLCWAHGGGRGVGSRQCEAITIDGLPCRSSAIYESDPPRCWAHHPGRLEGVRRQRRGRIVGSYKGQLYTWREVRALLELDPGMSVEEELAAARITVRRLLGAMRAELTPDQTARIAGRLLAGLNTVRRLVATHAERRQLYDALNAAIEEGDDEAYWEKMFGPLAGPWSE